MVSRKEKERAINFIGDMLEHSGSYEVKGSGYVVRGSTYSDSVIATEIEAEHPQKVMLVLANGLGTIDNYHQLVYLNAENGIYTAPVLYKDGDTAFVRMVDRNI